jgi:acyl dehydratase
MITTLKADEIEAAVGKELGVSDWFEVTQDDVNTFADVTRDHQFIHIDPDKAAKTPFGGTIAHGFMTLSMLSHLAERGAGVWVENADMGVNYGFDKVRFIHPVRVGSRIRAKSKLLSADEKSPGQYLFKSAITFEIDGVEKPALLAEWLTMAIINQ